jgi:hypothetical protein
LNSGCERAAFARFIYRLRKESVCTSQRLTTRKTNLPASLIACHAACMNSIAKLIASIAALIASLSFAWIALTITRTIPNQAVQITVYHRGEMELVGHGGFGQ